MKKRQSLDFSWLASLELWKGYKYNLRNGFDKGAAGDDEQACPVEISAQWFSRHSFSSFKFGLILLFHNI